MISKLFGVVLVLFDGMVTVLSKYVFKADKVFDVINVCCCCLILMFALTRLLNIGISHQSGASFFTPLGYLLWRLSFCSYVFFNILWFFGFSFEFFGISKNNFWVFLSNPHLVDNYDQIGDDRGRNFLCDRTLRSLFVKLYDKNLCENFLDFFVQFYQY